MLELENVSAGYGDSQVLWDISLIVEEGEIVTLLGNNGAGKSTTVGTIMGWVEMLSGSIRFRGDPIDDYKLNQRSDLGIAVVPEEEGIFPDMTVVDNLRLGAYQTPGDERKTRLEEVYELFPRLGERTQQYADTLSGGEKQMLKIGAALMHDPDLLLIDEPSLGLAPMLADEILDELLNIRKKGISILLVEQNVTKALKISDRGYLLENGRITGSDDADSLLNKDEIRKSYLGI